MEFSSEDPRTRVVIAQNTISHKIRSGAGCINEVSNSFLVHLVFPDPLGPVTIIEKGC